MSVEDGQYVYYIYIYVLKGEIIIQMYYNMHLKGYSMCISMFISFLYIFKGESKYI